MIELGAIEQRFRLPQRHGSRLLQSGRINVEPWRALENRLGADRQQITSARAARLAR
jgi:hypothetical protein